MVSANSENREGRRRLFWVAAVAGAFLIAGCSDPLAVTDGDIVTPDNLTDPTGLQTRRNGALFDFVRAYQGTAQTDGQVSMSCLMTDECRHSGTFTTRAEVEQRQIPDDNGTMSAVYRRLHQARVAAENTAAALEELGVDPGTDSRIAEMNLVAGYTYLAFASNYCNGVPFSQQGEELIFGDPETNAQAFQRAIDRFDQALAHPAVRDVDANAARVGRGRAFQGLGDFSSAAAAVAAVPTDFVKFSEHSNNSAAERNGIFEMMNNPPRWGIPDSSEGLNGIDWIAANDPRILFEARPGDAFDQSFPDHIIYINYDDRADPMRLALGVEARLIEAENQLDGGNVSGWLQTLNDLRAEWGNLADDVFFGDGTRALANLTDPGTAAGRVDMMFDERAYWLYLVNTRLFDYRRLLRQYGRNAEAVFPTGAYFKGGSFGTDIQFPIPQDEENNPNSIQCIDRNA